MRHRKSINHLGRKIGHRNAMLANMAASLILNKRIKTTTAKAKALKVFVEPLITKSKDDSTHSRRIVFSYLQDKNAVTELFREVSPKIMQRPGGYTRILKTGTRLGDNADICIIELVDYNENLLKTKEEATKTGRKRRRGGKKKPEGLAAGPAAIETEEGTDNLLTASEESTVSEETGTVTEVSPEEEGVKEVPEVEDTQPEADVKKEVKKKADVTEKKETKEKKDKSGEKEE